MMDPLSITTGVLTIIAYSVDAAQWIQNLKGIDDRIQGFVGELKSLAATHDALHKSLQQPAMLAAARNAEQNAGSELWKQIGQSVNDCQATMTQLVKLLNEIDRTSNSLVRRPLKLFKESMFSGQIATLRQRINFFNSTLALPLQMINVTLQIEQQELSTDQYNRLDSQISNLDRTISRLTAAVNPHIPAFGAASLRTSIDEETLVYEHLETCLETARKFCSNASVVSSVKSGASTITPYGVIAGTMAGLGSIAGDPMTSRSRNRIEDWIPAAPESRVSEEDVISTSLGSTAITSVTSASNRHYPRGSLVEAEDNDLQVERTQRFLRMGQTKLENQEYAGAEKAFLKAILELESHDIKDKIALNPSEVRLMLATTYLKQEKHDEAESILIPLAEEGDEANILQICSASHLLGETYLQKAALMKERNEEILEMALNYGFKGYKGRRQHLGKSSSLCCESASLLVLIHTARGDEAEVEMWSEIAAPQVMDRPPAPLNIEDSMVTLTREIEIFHRPSGNIPFQRPNKSKFYFGRKTSTAGVTSQHPKSPEPTSALTSFSENSGASIISNDPNSESPSPTLPATSLTEHPGAQRSSSWLSSASKSKSRSPSDYSQKSKAKPQPLAIDNRLRLVTREEAAEVRFAHIRSLCTRGDFKKAAKAAVLFMQAYVESGEVHFEKEIIKNVQKGGKLGLAATGQGYAPIHFFASLPVECAYEIRLLIQQGVDVNATDVLPDTVDPRVSHYRAIQLAVERGHTEIVKDLLTVPSLNVEVVDELGRTPVFVAAHLGKVEIVRMLLDYGALTVVPRSSSGTWDLLTQAVGHGMPEIARCVLDRGLPLSLRASKMPLLVLAVRTFNLDLTGAELQRKVAARVEMVEILLGAGADPHEEDEAGRTVMYYAALEGCQDIVKMLERNRESAEVWKPSDQQLSVVETGHGQG